MFHIINGMVLVSRLVLNGCLHVIGACPNLDSQMRKPSQLTREDGWWHGILMNTFSFWLLHIGFGFYTQPITWFEWSDFSSALMWHICVIEPLYYVVHRWLHTATVFKRLHHFHHQSIHTVPTTGLVQHWAEHIIYMALFGHMFIASALFQTRQPSVGFFFLYLWIFDICNAVGHVSRECFPSWWRTSGLFLFFYSPSYHQIHHQASGHFCLFMPLFDVLGGTYHPSLYANRMKQCTEAIKPTVKVVFLGHTYGPLSIHFPMLFTGENTFKPSPSLFRATIGSVTLFLLGIFRGRGGLMLARSTFRFQEQIIELETRGLMATPSQMKHNPTETNRNILRDIHAQPPGTLVVLGANTKSTELNQSGQWIQQRTSYQTVCHGNYLTALWCLGNLMMYLPFYDKSVLEKPILVIGASSSIGKQLVKFLLRRGHGVLFATSDGSRFTPQQGLEMVNTGSEDEMRSAFSRAAICLFGVMVDLSRFVCPNLTIFNFTAVEYPASWLRSNERIVEMALATLLEGSPLVYTGRYCHMLEPGRFHTCLLGGIVRALDGVTEHEPPLESADLSESTIQTSMQRYRDRFGLVPIPPSRSLQTGRQVSADWYRLYKHCIEWHISCVVETKDRSGYSVYDIVPEHTLHVLEWDYSMEQLTLYIE